MIRSRRKIEAVIYNAQCFMKVREEFGSFSEYLWGFSKGKIILYMGHQKEIFRQGMDFPIWSAKI